MNREFWLVCSRRGPRAFCATTTATDISVNQHRNWDILFIAVGRLSTLVLLNKLVTVRALCMLYNLSALCYAMLSTPCFLYMLCVCCGTGERRHTHKHTQATESRALLLTANFVYKSVCCLLGSRSVPACKRT